MVERVRADAGGPFKEFVFTEWLREGLNAMCDQWKRGKEQLDPDNLRRHLRHAQKEQLLAVRNMIDTAIERLEKTEAKK
jgi:hypothetical protein